MLNKTLVITGGNKGIGLSISETFIQAGYNVVIGARSETNLKDKYPEQVKFMKIDVKNENDHDKLIDIALNWTGAVDVYINNAGFSEWRPIEQIDNEFFDRMVGTNLKGAFWGCKAALKKMSDNGVIINISSIAGKRGSSNNAMYCATKFGMNGLTQALAKEVGVKGIRVNAICPVLIKTDGLVQALSSKYSPANGDVDGFLEKFSKQNSALHKLPTGSEVGSACLYLASDAASAITAQCINIDCGVLPQ